MTTLTPMPTTPKPTFGTVDTINFLELDAIVAYIEAHPEEWDQSYWAAKTACGTAYCIAGFAVIGAGAKPLFRNGYESTDAIFCSFPGSSEEYLISELAQEVLRLDESQSDHLFESTKTLEDIKAMIENWRAGRTVYEFADEKWEDNQEYAGEWVAP